MWFFRKKQDLPQGMIDLHNHVIPEIDDGASDLETSLEMFRELEQAGFKELSVSCHLGHPLFPDVTIDKIRQSVDDLRPHLDQASIDIKIHPGAEHYWGDHFMDPLDRDRLLPLGGKGDYYLIEFPFHDRMMHMKEIAFQLSLKGIRPILAHPERYAAVHRKPSLVKEWKLAGWIPQLDLYSLIHHRDKATRKVSRLLLKQRLYSIAATDFHSPHGKIPAMVEALVRYTDEDEAQRLMVTNPQRILDNKFVIEIEDD